jgi:hypothetical protein
MIGNGSVKSDPAPFRISDQKLLTGLFQVFEAKRVSVGFWTSVIMPSPWMWIVPSRFFFFHHHIKSYNIFYLLFHAQNMVGGNEPHPASNAQPTGNIPAVAIALTTLTYLIIVIRLIFRKLKRGKFQPDDYLISFAFIFYIVDTISTVVIVSPLPPHPSEANVGAE